MAKAVKKVSFSNVDEYMEGLPAGQRKMLEGIRKAIKAAAPKAEEVISYDMPTYKYLGNLIYFAAFKEHCSLFAVGKHNLLLFKKELEPFKISGSTLQFTVANPFPLPLLKKIVKLRVAENEEKAALKKK